MKKRIGGQQSAASHGSYVPEAGDLVWLSFSPQAGKEQAGRRPGLILSSRLYNLKSGLCVACPITNQAKGYPFEVELPEGLPVQGAILSDHVKSSDWQARQVEWICQAPGEVVDEVRAKLKPLLGT